eukprot:TRINITY_DN9231_c0_g1_i1.p1 TRINITY_DN9231_c0_g1~~TRINITY_DN9231_c0_g1_i1.p1  ORF type:complete len:249 (+),score=29.48 TRINITY_DN9231_c0_g1_i1:47-793(+)
MRADRRKSDFTKPSKRCLRKAGGKLSWLKLRDAVVAEVIAKQPASLIDIEELQLRVLASIPAAWLSSSSCLVRLPTGQSLRGERVEVDYLMADGAYSSFLGWIIDGSEDGATVVFDDVGEGWTVVRLKLRRCSHRLLGVSGLKVPGWTWTWSEEDCELLKQWVEQSKGSCLCAAHMHAWIACQLRCCVPETRHRIGGIAVFNKLLSMRNEGGHGKGHRLNPESRMRTSSQVCSGSDLHVCRRSMTTLN